MAGADFFQRIRLVKFTGCVGGWARYLGCLHSYLEVTLRGEYLMVFVDN